MCSNNIIPEILGIKEKNLKINDHKEEIINGITYSVIFGDLTCVPEKCPKCDSINENYSIVKNGTQKVKVLFNRANVYPLLLIMRKQRFLCKCCNSTFMAETNLTDKGCFISKNVKDSILINLAEIKSMDLIAREHQVSASTVARVLRTVEEKPGKKYLPKILGIDEFKSVSTVDASMSVNLVDNKNGGIYDILPDRRQSFLTNYFSSFPLKERRKVEFITMDMYAPYVHLARKLFPNAKIIIDKFHIVQLFTREFNKLRIQVMKDMNTKSRDYKILKNYWKLPLAKSWVLDCIHFGKRRYFYKSVCTVDILEYLLSLSDTLKEAHEFYQEVLYAVDRADYEMLKSIIERNINTIPACFVKSIKSLRRFKQPVLDALKYGYTNAVVEGKNNKIKALKRVAFGFRSFRNFRIRIMLMEKVKRQKGNIHDNPYGLSRYAAA